MKLSQLGKNYLIRVHPSEDNIFGSLSKGYLLVEGTRGRIAASLFYMLDVLRSIILYRWVSSDYVIFVRYLMGTAYLPSPIHKFAYLFFYFLVPTSDYMFFIDVRPEEAFKRIEKRSKNQREVFESLDKLSSVREKALELTSRGGWRILDGGASRQILNNMIIGVLDL
jgi:dTMP kinase